ncbi:MAG TPA: hypothetical protein DCZ03_01630 [Gammaproteobacteria bacterium]|nr:hypothetical protein [Gammaproteobacteria bacterium]
MQLLATPNELTVGETKEFRFGTDDEIRNGFLVHTEDGYRAYLNRCPHKGVSLNWQQNRFLSTDGLQIQCATHDARFNLSSGQCESGPCAGQPLTQLPLIITRNGVYLAIKES